MQKRARAGLIFVIAGIGYCCSILDTTIMQVALPTISRELHVTLTDAGYTIHVYNLVFAALLLITGKLADHYGHRRIFLIGTTIFALSSLGCSLAPLLPLLLFFRGTQALGGSALGSVGFAMISSVYPPEQPALRTRMFNLWSALAAVSAILGPVIGGLIVSHFPWNAIFWLQIPICGLLLLLASCFLPSFPASPQQFDFPGAFLFTVTLTCFSLLCLEGLIWKWQIVLMLFLGMLFGLVGFVLREKRVALPFLRFQLFRVRSFTIATLSMWFFWTSYQGATIVLSLYLSNGRGFSPELIALFLLPVPVANVCTSLLLGAHIAPAKRALLGALCGVNGFVWLAALPSDGAWFLIIAPALLIGCAASLCFTAFHNLVLSEIPARQSGQASGLFNLARQLGTTLGAVILLSSVEWQRVFQLAHAQTTHAATIMAYSGTWYVAALLALSVVPLLFLQKKHSVVSTSSHVDVGAKTA